MRVSSQPPCSIIALSWGHLFHPSKCFLSIFLVPSSHQPGSIFPAFWQLSFLLSSRQHPNNSIFPAFWQLSFLLSSRQHPYNSIFPSFCQPTYLPGSILITASSQPYDSLHVFLAASYNPCTQVAPIFHFPLQSTPLSSSIREPAVRTIYPGILTRGFSVNPPPHFRTKSPPTLDGWVRREGFFIWEMFLCSSHHGVGFTRGKSFVF
jgi:hypothetical protein